MKVKKKVFILTLSLILTILLISFFPVLEVGAKGSFFSIDPNVMYVSNALSYIKTKQIHYFDHPGTPSIVLLSFAFTPLRLYTKFVAKLNFISWSAIHYDVVFFYARAWMSLIVGAGLGVLFYSIYKFTNKSSSIFLLAVLLLTFPPFYYLGISISAEALNFLLAALWLLLLVIFVKREKMFFLYAMALLAGVAFGNRATSVALALSTLTLGLTYGEKIISNRVLSVVKLLILEVLGYYFALWPIRRKILIVTKIILFLSGGTKIHGGGSGQFFAVDKFLKSLQFLTTNDNVAVVTSVAVVLYCFVKLFSSVKTSKYLATVGLTTAFVVMGFAKFPLDHYQTVNYLLLSFIGVSFASFTVTNLQLLTLPLLLIFIIPITNGFLKGLTKSINTTVSLRNFENMHAAKEGTVWQYGRSEEFAILWSRYWGRGIFEEELKKFNPPIYELENGLQDVGLSLSEQKPLFDICWDRLYLENKSLESFLLKYKDMEFDVAKVPNTNLDLITSKHCEIKKP